MILVYEGDGEKVKVGDVNISYGKMSRVIGWEAPRGNEKFTIPGAVFTRDEESGEINSHFAMNLGMKWKKG